MPATRRIDKPQQAQFPSHDILDRQPPSSIKTERCLLGSILLKPDVCDDVLLILRAHDFYDRQVDHQRDGGADHRPRGHLGQEQED